MLKLETVFIRAANFPKTDVLPDIKHYHAYPFFALDESVARGTDLRLGEGMVASTLPYRMQADYDRAWEERPFTAAVLENEQMRAVFLPELGGRLWSLFDKTEGRELLYKNSVIAYCNLALRNAWFAGGVEWNIGVRGHSYLTCAPLFAAREINAQGEEILKLYEYEAVRGLAFVIRAGLSGRTLRVQVTIENTRNEPSYTYWWSNIAIAQNEGTRVIVPASESYVTSYRDNGYVISKTEIPMVNGKDISYPGEAETAKDYFFDIPREEKKWIAALEKDGKGLLQSSSEILLGRKLFVWGKSAGGGHWNRWLTDGGSYAEIQAGLAKTQFEHLPIGAKEIIRWNESYRAVCVENPDADYRELTSQIGTQVQDCDFDAFFEAVKEERMLCGSGRGALASLLDPSEKPTICSFPTDTLTEEEAYFVSLIRGEKLQKQVPLSYAIDPRYLTWIENKGEKSDYDRYQSGVLYYACGNPDRAYEEWEKVGGEFRFAARACMAMLEDRLRGNAAKAFALIAQAQEEKTDDTELLVLYGEIAMRAGEFSAFLKKTEHVRNGRLRMYRAKCLMELGELAQARTCLSEDLVVADMREGEYALSAIWVDLYRRVIAAEEHREPGEISAEEVLTRYPIPYALDFRMH